MPARVFNATVVMNPGSNEGAQYSQARENVDMRPYPSGWREGNFLGNFPNNRPPHWPDAAIATRPHWWSGLHPKRAQAVRRFFQPAAAIINLTNNTTISAIKSISAIKNISAINSISAINNTTSSIGGGGPTHYRIDMGREVQRRLPSP